MSRENERGGGQKIAHPMSVAGEVVVFNLGILRAFDFVPYSSNAASPFQTSYERSQRSQGDSIQGKSYLE